MREKEDKKVRVGCGRYDWVFDEGDSNLASQLIITFEAIQVLPTNNLNAIFDWVQRLEYPWTSASSVVAKAPALRALAPVMEYLKRQRNGAT